MNGFNHLVSKSIPNGTRFVAIYGDGSGANLFMIDDSGHLLDAEFADQTPAPDTWLMDAGYQYWMKIPDTFKLWFEHTERRP